MYNDRRAAGSPTPGLSKKFFITGYGVAFTSIGAGMQILHERLALMFRKTPPDLPWGKEELGQEGFFSQFGQDKFVAERLRYKRNGIFLDVGAADGIDMSNSNYFEKELDWSGVAIEPHPVNFLRLKENRKCNLVHGCISNFHGEAVFHALKGGFSQLSSMVDTCPSQDEGFHGTDASGKDDDEFILVPCYTINDIAEQYGLNQIDFLSIDTEGEELRVILGINFHKIRIEFITIERNKEHEEVQKLLYLAGYRTVANAGCDEIFQRNR